MTFGEELFCFLNFGALHVADLSHDVFHGGCDDAQCGKEHRVAVAWYDLGADRLWRQAKLFADVFFDGWVNVGECANSAGDCAGCDFGASVDEAVAPTQRYAVALHLRTLDFIEGIDLRGHQPVAFLLRETSASLHAIDRVDDRVDGVMGSTQARTQPTPPRMTGFLRGRRASSGRV